MSYYIIIRGPLASGKSTITRELAKIIGATPISIDRILEEHKLTRDKEEGYISQQSFKQANELSIPQAQKVLQQGKPVIFDGNFYWQSQIEDLIERLPYTHYIFTLKAPVELCIARDRERGETHGEGAARVVHKKVAEFDHGIIIDVNKPLRACIEEILSYLPTK